MNRGLGPLSKPFQVVEASERNTRNLEVITGLARANGRAEDQEKEDQPMAGQLGKGVRGAGYTRIRSRRRKNCEVSAGFHAVGRGGCDRDCNMTTLDMGYSTYI
jgi:hypothetical protein